jgi:hypothetical protein
MRRLKKKKNKQPKNEFAMKPCCVFFHSTPSSPQLQNAEAETKTLAGSSNNNSLAFFLDHSKRPDSNFLPCSRISKVSAYQSTKAHCKENMIY